MSSRREQGARFRVILQPAPMFKTDSQVSSLALGFTGLAFEGWGDFFFFFSVSGKRGSRRGWRVLRERQHPSPLTGCLVFRIWQWSRQAAQVKPMAEFPASKKWRTS